MMMPLFMGEHIPYWNRSSALKKSSRLFDDISVLSWNAMHCGGEKFPQTVEELVTATDGNEAVICLQDTQFLIDFSFEFLDYKLIHTPGSPAAILVHNQWNKVTHDDLFADGVVGTIVGVLGISNAYMPDSNKPLALWLQLTMFISSEEPT